jgi:hypothetical protein
VDVALPTLAVVLTWLCAGTVLAGCGSLVRRMLVPGARGLAAVDLWLGLAGLIAYVQLWNLGVPVDAWALLAPAAIGAAGVALGARRLARPARPWVLAPALVGTLWAANRALGTAFDYDLGLYHLNVVGYALEYPTPPGLANLHERLGAGDAHLLLVALLHHGPWGGAAPHLLNGLLLSLLFFEVASRFARGGGAPYANRVALLLAPAAVVVAGAGTGYRLASPNLDLGAFVLVAVAALYAAEAVEREFEPTAALASTALLAAAAATRPLYWLATLATGGFLAYGLRSTRLVVLPAILLAGCLARQAVLSGYPFFPTTAAGLPVDWRVPSVVVEDQNRVTTAWARWPGHATDDVFGSWHWLSVWTRARARDLDVLAPLALLAALVPALVAGRPRPAAPMLVVVAPALGTLAAWFVVAPDPRFAFAPLWLVPIALAAWALPPARPSRAVIAAGVAAAAALAVVGTRHAGWYLLAALDVWALTAIALRLGSGRSPRWLAPVALVSVALAPIGIVADRGAFGVVAADGGGPLGTTPIPIPTLEPVRTTSGLELTKPVGTDQCWAVLLCAPQPGKELHLRGGGVRSGFSADR